MEWSGADGVERSGVEWRGWSGAGEAERSGAEWSVLPCIVS